MTTSLTRDLKRQDVMMRKMFVDAIRGDGYKVATITPEVFHETLILAKDRNWIHPTSLAEAVRGSDSNVRKWFEKEAGKRSTPARSTMANVLEELSRLIHEDVARIEAEEPTLAEKIIGCR